MTASAVPELSGCFLKKRQALRILRSKIEGRIVSPLLLFQH
ncbi:ABC transporter ATP-binding protein [Raoultella sp. RIT712]|nr:ABC transporter ATP-binding protein [Raoultella sp. RIT712]